MFTSATTALLIFICFQPVIGQREEVLEAVSHTLVQGLLANGLGNVNATAMAAAATGQVVIAGRFNAVALDIFNRNNVKMMSSVVSDNNAGFIAHFTAEGKYLLIKK